jgi:hypothetical protein
VTDDRKLLHAYAISQYDSVRRALQALNTANRGSRDDLRDEADIYYLRGARDGLLMQWSDEYGPGWDEPEDLDLVYYEVHVWLTNHVRELDLMLARKGMTRGMQ